MTLKFSDDLSYKKLSDIIKCRFLGSTVLFETVVALANSFQQIFLSVT
jgi:hypothetical protein